MKKIAIVCDSSASISKEYALKNNIFVAPLTLIHDGQEFSDQITISYEEVNDLLRERKVVKTSQPNLGLLIEMFESLKHENYDHVFVISLSSYLSGTFAAFHQAIEQVGLTNVTCIDSYSLGGPVQNGIEYILNMNAAGASFEDIKNALVNLYNSGESYVLPLDLHQLKASGRISKGAATLATLLKVKALLKLENKGETIEKFGTARTEAKAFSMIIDDLIAHNTTPDKYRLYVLQSEAMDTAKRAVAAITERLGEFEVSYITLPAAIATHAGLGTIAVQSTLKM